MPEHLIAPKGPAAPLEMVRLELMQLREGLKECNKRYSRLFFFLAVILKQLPEMQISFKKGDLEATENFGDSWEIQESYDPEAEEVIFRLRAKGGEK